MDKETYKNLTYFNKQKCRKEIDEIVIFFQKCFKCHNLCKTCLGWGTFSCPVCRYYRFQKSCFSECPSQDTYPTRLEGENIECGRCHVQCKRGCDGPMSTNCRLCANVKIIREYQDEVTGEMKLIVSE